MASSTASSPSLYASPPMADNQIAVDRQVGCRPDVLETRDSYDEADDEEAEIRRRLSLRGPFLRKFTSEAPWGQQNVDNLTPGRPRIKSEDSESFRSTRRSERSGTSHVALSRNTRTTHEPAKSPDSTTRSSLSLTPPSSASNSSSSPGRRFAPLGHHLLPSSSGRSICSSRSFQTCSSEAAYYPITPKSIPGTEMVTLDVQYAIHRFETGKMRLDEPFDILKPRRSFSAQSFSHLHTAKKGHPGTSTFLRDLSPNLPSITVPLQDRPLVRSGSPGFGLMSLEDARKRESVRNRLKGDQSQHEIASLSNSDNNNRNVKGRKSSIMNIFTRQYRSQERVSRIYSIGEPLTAPPRAAPVPASLPGGVPVTEMSEKATLHDTAPNLELRPVSVAFSRALPADYLFRGSVRSSILEDQEQQEIVEIDSPPLDSAADGSAREQIHRARQGWQMQLYELQAQIRELRDELRDVGKVKKSSTDCSSCGCACGGSQRLGIQSSGSTDTARASGSLIDRARAKTGGARGVFGSGSLYEWD